MNQSKQTYLDFETPIKEIDEKISKLSLDQNNIKQVNDLKILLKDKTEEIYSNLSRWQKVQLARHPNRPYSLDYINYFCNNFFELHGDRSFGDDPSVVTGIGSLGSFDVAYIGQQKGRNTKENLHRNFGMMKPEGYRKALRIMKLAEKFNLPIITLMDTIGAYPGLGAEERGQGQAIANNLFSMAELRVPIISVVIGEGASGGALGIGVCDRMLMMENTWYSVISPEGCASILFRDAKKAEEAAEALKPTPDDLVKMGICDKIIGEPNGGAHRDFHSSASKLKEELIKELEIITKIDRDQFLDNRILKYDKLGYFNLG